MSTEEQENPEDYSSVTHIIGPIDVDLRVSFENNRLKADLKFSDDKSLSFCSQKPLYLNKTEIPKISKMLRKPVERALSDFITALTKELNFYEMEEYNG